LVAEGKLLKLGRQLAVGDVLIYSQGDPRPVARSTMTYAIPPKKAGTA
jgi:acyl-coenzyme A thioesterase PaaI-like protein